MTQSPLVPSPHGLSPARPSRLRVLMRAFAVLSCIPYLGLKIAWLSGSRIGIPEGSVLLDEPVTVAVANAVTVLMDGAVIVLALLLTQDWGRRVPAWLLAVPMWAAGGLLLPIMTSFPVQVLVQSVDGNGAEPSADDAFLDAWVFGVVYSGFIVQGLALGTLFVLYARDRWGHLWQGGLRDLPVSASGRPLKVLSTLAAVLVLFPVAMHLLWAFGATTGLPDGRVDKRAADFYVLQGIDVLFLAAAVAGALLLAFRRRGALPLKAPLAMAWLGSGAVGCWGAWLLVASLLPTTEKGERATELMTLTYAVSMIVGLLLVAGTASLLRRRGA
ncbi:hypothetical protein AB0M39_37495 [Streptomyces sp. NPDC051907]|uniref:hypothetical protein n=1 Tax=Streptomyces sp. NPDC051907 TaxID=3155284 RepID=UPI0034285502